MKGIKKLQALAESREQVARAAHEAARHRHAAAREEEDAQSQFLETFKQTAQQRRRERNRDLLRAPVSRARLSLVSLQFLVAQEEINYETEKLELLERTARALHSDMDREGARLRACVIKQKKLTALQEKQEKRQRRLQFLKSNRSG